MSTSPSNHGLYFIAIIPPDPLYADAQRWKEHFAIEYASKASLNSPPHITLHMPFKCKIAKESSLMDALSKVGGQSNSFDLKIHGFDAFAPRIIFMKIIEELLLRQLHGNIQQVMKTQFNIFNADYRNHPFHPHLTLAFRDLKKSNFELAWSEFESKPYKGKFLVDQFWLLKHDGKRWQKMKSFSLHE